MIIRNVALALLLLAAISILNVQTNSTTAGPKPIKPDGSVLQKSSLESLQLEKAKANQRVLQIVNRPVRSYVRSPNMRVWISSPGWFHEGASKPDFNTVDVRKSQTFPYATSQYVASDLNPKIVFLGPDLEFNSMTKFFYTDRSVPKHRLTETEMLEINQLYRIIGRCESEIERLQAPPVDKVQTSVAAALDPVLDRILSMPEGTRTLYIGIALGGLILVVILYRSVKR